MGTAAVLIAFLKPCPQTEGYTVSLNAPASQPLSVEPGTREGEGALRGPSGAVGAEWVPRGSEQLLLRQWEGCTESPWVPLPAPLLSAQIHSRLPGPSPLPQARSALGAQGRHVRCARVPRASGGTSPVPSIAAGPPTAHEFAPRAMQLWLRPCQCSREKGVSWRAGMITSRRCRRLCTENFWAERGCPRVGPGDKQLGAGRGGKVAAQLGQLCWATRRQWAGTVPPAASVSRARLTGTRRRVWYPKCCCNWRGEDRMAVAGRSRSRRGGGGVPGPIVHAELQKTALHARPRP